MAIKKCPYCKAIIDNSAEFCSNCGTKLLFPEDEMIEEDIPGEKVQEKEELEKKPARKRKPRRKKAAAVKKTESAADEALAMDSAPPPVDEVAEEALPPRDVTAADVDQPGPPPDSFDPEKIEPDTVDPDPAEIDSGQPEADSRETIVPDDIEPSLDKPAFEESDIVDPEPPEAFADEPLTDEPELQEPDEFDPSLEEPGFTGPPIQLDEPEVPGEEDGFDPVEIIDDTMGVPEAGPESLTPSEPLIPAEDAGDLDTDEWDVDEHIREKETGELPDVPGSEPLPDEDGPDPALFPDEGLNDPEDSQDDPEFKTADLEKMVDPAEKEKEEIERFLDSLKKERQEIKDKYGDDTTDLPAWASNKSEDAAQTDLPPDGEQPVSDVPPAPDQGPETLSGPELDSGPEMPTEAETEFDTEPAVESEPGFVPEAGPDLEPVEISEPSPPAAAIPREEKYEEPGLLFGSTPASSSEPKKKKIRRRKAFLPKDVLSLLKVRVFDALFIAALWFITLWIASRLTEVSVFKLIGDSLPATLALYIILLGLYFFFFFFFLGETLGNQLFSQEE